MSSTELSTNTCGNLVGDDEEMGELLLKCIGFMYLPLNLAYSFVPMTVTVELFYLKN